MKRITTIMKKVFTNKFVVAAAVLTVVAVPVIGRADYGPTRTPFDYNKAPVNGSTCTDADKTAYDSCGSLTGPVFDSFINTPEYGDERSFFDARNSDASEQSFSDTTANVNDGSKEVIMRVYIHNNGNQALNGTDDNGVSVAKDTSVKITLPSGTDSTLSAQAAISASNATTVTDTTNFTADGKFSLSYEPGSAVIYNAAHPNGAPVSDSIVTSGAEVGYQNNDGVWPGCFDFAGTVDIKVKVTPVAPPVANIDLTKQVRVVGATDKTWQKRVDTTPGSTVQYLLTTTDTGTTNEDNTTVRDVLPPNETLVPGSVKLIDVNNPNPGTTEPDDSLNDGGLNIGGYAPGGGAYIELSATVDGNFDGCNTVLRNQAFVKSTQTPTEVGDVADVGVTKTNCTPPVTPTYTCNNLDKDQISNTDYTFTANGSATNANITGYTFMVNGATVQDNTSNTYAFSNSNPATYTVTAIVKTDQGNTTVTPACTQTVTVPAPPVTPVYTCDSLDEADIDRTNFAFQANGTATNATITGYAFSVNGKQMQDGTSPYYVFSEQTPGDYTVTAIVKTDQGNTTVNDACTYKATVTPPPTIASPVYSCDKLDVQPVTGTGVPANTYKFTTYYTAEGQGYNTPSLFYYDFGDGSQVLTSSNSSVQYTYPSAKAGQQFVPAVSFKVLDANGNPATITGDNCKATTTIPTPPATTVAKTTSVVTTLVNTGPGAVVGLFAAVSIVSAFAYRKLLSRHATK